MITSITATVIAINDKIIVQTAITVVICYLNA